MDWIAICQGYVVNEYNFNSANSKNQKDLKSCVTIYATKVKPTTVDHVFYCFSALNHL